MALGVRRRTFLLGTAVGAMAAYAGAWWLYKVRPRDYSDIVLAVLRKHLGHLRIKDGDFERFAAEFRPHYRDDPILSWAGLGAPLYRWTGIRDLVPEAARLHDFEEHVVGTFLLSTDFFWRGADETRELLYVGYDDPYRRPCQNPFARLT